MAQSLKGRKVAILATDGFEESELFDPKKALDEAGAQTTVVSLKKGEIKAWKDKNWGKSIAVDLSLDEADAEDFDALLLPGGVMNPDKLRNDEKAVAFAQSFVDDEKPIAAICHGPQLLIETGILSGRRVTSFPSVKTDIINAGGDWHDAEVITDNGLVTSRKPDDIPAFNKKMIEEFAEGRHTGRSADQSSHASQH
ncbi:glutamine amidotransferase [Bdellovibrio bacteriovorus]|uniref:Glutamine amidotransferase n=1 Tax=Bdellovibrio bacteriovorus TaxID=959 RepID=A0A150WIX2_BDEBC|nr:type 1 glutamine amidotransferase domain-containing protein [Bdellovibrio bacteriovorus]KYG63634.1 glutamine amidotransferase [Bdellovibrio bacteriovorus]